MAAGLVINFGDERKKFMRFMACGSGSACGIGAARAIAAVDGGIFDAEIAPFNGVTRDEPPRRGALRWSG
jgi:hypothetical protein